MGSEEIQPRPYLKLLALAGLLGVLSAVIVSALATARLSMIVTPVKRSLSAENAANA